MLIVMRASATDEQIDGVVRAVAGLGYEARPLRGRQRTAIGVLGNDQRVDGTRFLSLPGVADVIHVTKPYKQVSREWHPESTVIELDGGVRIGGEDIVVMAGPCAVETEKQLMETAVAVRNAGAVMLRAGAWKPRTSPYSFQGLGAEALGLIDRVRAETGLLVVTEAVDVETLPLVSAVADIVQIGARNMQNFSLLRAAGRQSRPVLLKRGLAATVQELLLAAEYIVAEGNTKVILCERGVRGFDPGTRNVFDLGAIPLIHALSHLPVIADPSHGTGRREVVLPMARAAIAAGADGLLVEVHPQPGQARSDGAQSLTPDEFRQLMRDTRPIADAIGRRVVEPTGVLK